MLLTSASTSGRASGARGRAVVNQYAWWAQSLGPKPPFAPTLIGMRRREIFVSTAVFEGVRFAWRQGVPIVKQIAKQVS